MASDTGRADYGIDAPGVIRNLVLVGCGACLVAGASLAGMLPAEFVFQPVQSFGVRFALVPTGFFTGLGCLSGAAWMYFGSRYGKVAERNALLDRIDWKGDENVLDVGCGRGLLLVGAAQRVKSGRVTGIDIWQAEDLSGNRAEVPLENAELEGVHDRVAVETADMRRMPFADAAFDVIVSRAAIHNLYSVADRAAAIREIARVLRPGGRALISDIRHQGEYARVFAESGCRDIRRLDTRIVSTLCALCTFGSLRPHITLATKAR